MTKRYFNRVFKKKLWKASKQKKQVGESDKVVKSDQKSASNRSNVNNGKKCKLCGRVFKLRECPAYGQECCKCKKNHWANCCYTRKVHEASTALSNDFLLEEFTISKEKKVTEAFVIGKINSKKVKAKLDNGVEVNVIPLQI